MKTEKQKIKKQSEKQTWKTKNENWKTNMKIELRIIQVWK